MTGRVEHVTVQFSHPDDDSDIARELRQEGLVPLLINGTHVAATTEDHMQQAMDLAVERLSEETADETDRFRRSVVEALADAIEAGEDADFTDFPSDALILLAEGLVHHGYRQAGALPFCAVRFLRDDPGEPVIAARPRAN